MQLNNDLNCKDPAEIYLQSEEVSLKETQGCAVCLFRNKKHTFGDSSPCDDLTRQPLKGQKFCHQWEHDESLC